MVCELRKGVEESRAFGLVEARGVREGYAAVGDYLVLFGGDAVADGGTEGEVLLVGVFWAWVRVGLDREYGVDGSGFARVEGGEVTGVGILDK